MQNNWKIFNTFSKSNEKLLLLSLEEEIDNYLTDDKFLYYIKCETNLLDSLIKKNHPRLCPHQQIFYF